MGFIFVYILSFFPIFYTERILFFFSSAISENVFEFSNAVHWKGNKMYPERSLKTSICRLLDNKDETIVTLNEFSKCWWTD